MKKITLLILTILAFNSGFGQILTFDFDGLTGNEESADSNFNDTNLAESTIIRGDGLTASANGDRFNALNWNTGTISDAITENDYMQFTLAPNSGYEFEVTTIDVNFARSANGPGEIILRNSIDGYSTNIDGIKTVASTTNTFTFTVNQASSATAVTYRVYGYNAVSGTGTGGFEGTDDDIEVNGTVSALSSCGVTTTWNGSTWSSGTPDNSLEAILNEDYDTSIDGSFSACTLTVNSNYQLIIADNTYIEVQTNLTVNADAEILVSPQGSFVQNDDLGSITLGTGGTVDGLIKVTKKTAPMNAWYEYTYWSSPVSGESIGSAIDGSNYYLRFSYNAQNYLDSTSETNNNNVVIANTQDDIDDNGDDWTWINGGATIMTPGIGYAMTLTDIAYDGAPGTANKEISFTFEGPFNNGEYDIAIYRNDSELNDSNWNMLGNPYPSAIDVDVFLAKNRYDASSNPTGTLDGAIYLWSQNTAPSSLTNGNSALNFPNSDYAIINGLATTAGGDGIDPSNRKIPSGQAFFVTYSNDATPDSSLGDIKEGTATFNNSMRTKGTNDNSLFFKNNNNKSNNFPNKLWINLTSDNGMFNQIAIGYVEGATNGNDGSFYDAPKNGSSGSVVSLYTTIEGSNQAFAIQGKALNSLSVDETINLGFKSQIEIATLFKLSIDHLQGDFLTGNTIYLKDNLLNKLHDLSNSDYSFTSEVGEFNDRFEIVFTEDGALSINDVDLNTNKFSIIDLNNSTIQFKTNTNLEIRNISLFDLLGKQVYHLSGKTNSETYNLPRLKNSVYIAKIELSNGSVITKKAVKN